MKPVIYIALFGALFYGCLRLGKYLANRKPKDLEPSNNSDDNSHNPFIN